MNQNNNLFGVSEHLTIDRLLGMIAALTIAYTFVYLTCYYGLACERL